MPQTVIDILLLRRLNLIRPIRYAIFVLLIGSFIAGLIYTAVVFNALAERNQAPHVHPRHAS